MTITYRNDETTFPLNRRDVLKLAAVGAGMTALGTVGFSGRAAASNHQIETLYLTDSGGDNAGNFLTKLYTVELDDVSGRANLTLELELTDTDFGQVDAIAASLDGLKVYMVDKTSRHLGIVDFSGGSPVFSDEGAIAGLPGGVVLATFGPDGVLYVASQDDDAMYTIDISGPTATKLFDISGVDVQGADIAFDADETLFLYSSGAQALYTVDLGTGAATKVGDTGDFFTGLAVRDAGNGDLVGSNTTRDEIVVVNKSTGAQDAQFPMYLNDSPYAYGFGDMTVGFLDVETCEPCDLPEGYKFEYVYEEDEYGQVITDGFVLEDGMAVDGLTITGYGGEMGEPMSVDVDTEFCDLYVLVKSGQEFEVQSFADIDGSITIETANDEKYAISFVQFFCSEADAVAAMESFPSRGRGRSR